ncbi:hypothetical protein QE152_g4265 [Popillia japonica]|uniref:Uncharacterized protein n=1 Tax=Popillia japonica TaxID=7064 RepID=A0AAW1N306_POPJA
MREVLRNLKFLKVFGGSSSTIIAFTIKKKILNPVKIARFTQIALYEKMVMEAVNAWVKSYLIFTYGKKYLTSAIPARVNVNDSTEFVEKREIKEEAIETDDWNLGGTQELLEAHVTSKHNNDGYTYNDKSHLYTYAEITLFGV